MLKCMSKAIQKEAVEQKIKEITEKIVKEYQPEKIILFGSWAWGNPGPDSDVDLFIVKETENTRELARQIDGSIYPRPFPVDLIVYRPQQIIKSLSGGNLFIRDILTNGRILYAR